MQDLSISGNK